MSEPAVQPPGIGVYHKHRPRKGVEQHIVRRLRPDAVDGEQAVPQPRRVPLRERLEPALGKVPDAKITQPFGLDIEITGRLEPAGQTGVRGRGDYLGIQGLRLFQVLNRLFDIAPGGILGEHRAHHHLKRGLAGPPSLRAIAPMQAPVNAVQVLI